jgi:hypothetical protein
VASIHHHAEVERMGFEIREQRGTQYRAGAELGGRVAGLVW